MRKCCTTCGEDLSLWDVMQGRIDHRGCWESSIVKLLPDDKQTDQPSAKPTKLFKLVQIISPGDRTIR